MSKSKKIMVWCIGLMLFVAYHGWALCTMFSYQYLDLTVKPAGNDVIIQQIGDFMPEGNLGLQVNDVIKSINGLPAHTFPSVQNWSTVNKAVELVIQRGSETFQIKMLQRDYTQDIRAIVAGIICYVMAFVIFQSNREKGTGQILALVFFASGLLFISIILTGRGDVLGKYMVLNLFVSLPIFFFHFLLTFFRVKAGIDLTKTQLRVLKASYQLLGLCAALSLLYFVPSKGILVSEYFSIVGLLFISFCLIDLVYIIRLSIQYGHHSYMNTLLKTVLFFFVVSSFPILFLYLIPYLTSNAIALPGIYSGLLFLLFPASFAYLIKTKQVYDIPLVTRRLFFTTLIGIVPSLGLAFVVAAIIPDVTMTDGLLLLVIFGIVITTMLYTLENFKTGLDKMLFPRKYHLQHALNNIANKLRNIQTFRELKDIILRDIMETIDVNGAAIVFQKQDALEINSIGKIDENKIRAMVQAQNLDDLYYSTFQIQSNEEHTSYLVMSEKRSNTKLGLEDTQWIWLIISYLAVSLENLYLIRKLTSNLEELAATVPNENAEDFSWIRKMMFDVQESERERIAVDLHDSTMQDLFYLKRKIVNMFQKYNVTPEDHEAVRGLVSYIEVINSNLRDSCFELHPYLLSEIGLIQTMRSLIEKESPEFEIQFNSRNNDSIESIHLEHKKHIFRVFQELLANAKKHSEAEHVFFTIDVVQDQIVFRYWDDGVGFDPGQVGTMNIGLRQIRSRVLHMKGQITVASDGQEGTRITIELPLLEN